MCLLACCCQLTQAQNVANKVFEKYSQMDEGILSMEATGQQMSQMTKDAKEKAALEKVTKMKIIHTATKKLATSMEADFKSLESAGYTKLTNNSGQTVLVKKDGNASSSISEAIFFNNSEKGCSMAFFIGKLSEEDVKVLKLGRFM